MFGMSLSELLPVSLVTVLVLGPERLPAAARTAGLWFGAAFEIPVAVVVLTWTGIVDVQLSDVLWSACC